MTTPLDGRIGGTTYSAPDDAVVKRTFELFATDEHVGQNCYLAFWLALGAGLRRGEISNLQWQHIVVRVGQPWVCGGVGKDGQRVEVPIQQAAWNAIAPYKRDTGFVISERGLGWARRLSAHLASCGWTARKRLHELRAYIGSLLYQVQPVAAMRFLRHKSIRTTEQFYVRHFAGIRMPDVLPCVPPPKGEESPPK